MKLDGKVAIVTGAGSGMGRAIAHGYAREGARVVVSDVNASAAQSVVDEITRAGGVASASQTDVRDQAQVQAMVDLAVANYGGLDILVNNAGVGEHASVDEVTPESFQRMFDIHVKGSFFCGQAVIPSMKERRRGKIVNISSIWGMNGADTASHYCAAKAALLGLTKAWAKELAPWNIHVNAVCPGGVITEMPIRVQGWDKIREKEKRVPLGRWAQPEEISYAVAFFAGGESDFVTGQAISPNGGETIVGF